MVTRDLEHGLNERIINRIARDTFGFFYLFSNNSIQRYDGTDFENVDIPIGAEELLKDISNVTTDNYGGLLLHTKSIDRELHISPSSLTARYSEVNEDTIGLNYLIEIGGDLAKYVIRGNDTIVASRGSFWNYNNGNLSQLAYNDINNFNCNVITKDNYGNIIAAFGYSAGASDLVLVLSPNNEISDYSDVLDYNNNIKDIYCDDIAHQWMIATFNGLYIYSFQRSGIEIFHVVDNVSSSEFGHIVLGVSADGPDVLFADENYGLRKINKSGKVDLLFPEETVHFFDNEKVLYDDLTSQYYITANYTDEETIIYITDTTYSKLVKQIVPFTVHDFIVLNEDELLLVGEYKEENDKTKSGRIAIWNTKIAQGQMKINSVPIIRSVASIGNSFWIGTADGIYVYNKSFTLQQKVESGLNNPYILCLKEIDDKVYAGSYGGGLYVLNRETKKVIRHYDKSTFLSDNIVAAIEKDNKGFIWLSTFNGINVLNKDGEIISKLMDYDGISHREMNTNAISKDGYGNIYFGTLNGLTKVNPQEVLDWSTSYGLHVSGATAYYNDNGKVIDVSKTPISIESGFDSLLVSVDFPNCIKTIFDTPLNYLRINDDSSHVLAYNNKKILLTRSDLGYDNTVNLYNSNNSYETVLAFEPKLDLAKGLISFLVLLCLVGVVFATLYRQKIMKVITEQDEKIKFNKRIAELELSALQSQMNPHFIFNALGAIQYFIQIQKTDEADNFLADFAMLMRKILESSKTKYISLREEKEILGLYFNLEQLRFEGLFDYTWYIDDNVDMEKVIPPMILQPFIENAINHGLFALKGRKGKIDIYLDQISENTIQFTIEDNGIGRKQAAALRNKEHKSRGLQIVDDRISTLNSLGDVVIEVETQDLYQDNEPSGTKVIINIGYLDIHVESY